MTTSSAGWSSPSGPGRKSFCSTHGCRVGKSKPKTLCFSFFSQQQGNQVLPEQKTSVSDGESAASSTPHDSTHPPEPSGCSVWLSQNSEESHSFKSTRKQFCFYNTEIWRDRIHILCCNAIKSQITEMSSSWSVLNVSVWEFDATFPDRPSGRQMKQARLKVHVCCFPLLYFLLEADGLYTERVYQVCRGWLMIWGFLEANTDLFQKLQACILTNFVLGRKNHHLDDHLVPATLDVGFFFFLVILFQIFRSSMIFITHFIWL